MLIQRHSVVHDTVCTMTSACCISPSSNVEHGILQCPTYGIWTVVEPPQLLRFCHDLVLPTSAGSRGATVRHTLQQRMNVTSTTLASEISIVRRRHQTDGLGRASEHVADVVRQALQLVRADADLVVDDVVVCRSCRPHESY